MGRATSYALKYDKPLLQFSEIKAAKERLEGISAKTELIYSSFFSNEYQNEVYIKPENLQTTGAYKLRGAYNKISKLSDSQKKRGLIASSAGNHAQGVAYSAQKLGIEATIVMPKTTPLIKVEATKKYGAKVVLAGDNYDAAYNEAQRLQKKMNYTFVHPFNDLDIMAGQGSIGIEILEELQNADIILAPVGGGGLISGIAVAAKSINPNIKVIGVEPEGANAMRLSIDKNKLVSLDRVETIADGVAVKTPGDLTFSIIRDYVDDIITVSDFDIMEALLILLERHKLVAEPAGALSLAALKKLNVQNKNIVSVISGGNIDVVTMSSLINHGLVSRGRLFCFSVNLPDTPGQLLNISKILADIGANVIKLDHNQFKGFDRFKNVQLEVTVETNGHDHIGQIIDSLRDHGYGINKVY
ncbi:threonine ammonia-lyase [Wukongibacter baidiensis]|uniref:threonine ammonia-lyase n=1 Tax=Wukongibacter baidiensis TaxID=1723361 RepID=UPI003D7F7E6F